MPRSRAVPRFLHPFAKPTRERFITVARGDGARIYDADGREYIDGMASLWYCAIGHGRREMADAIAKQVTTIEAYSAYLPQPAASTIGFSLVRRSTSPALKVSITVAPGPYGHKVALWIQTNPHC